MSQDPNLRNATSLANTVGQAGCVTGFVAIIIIAIAFGIGTLLDNLLGFDQRIMTVALLLLSFPVTLFVMVRVGLFIAGKANRQLEQEELQKHEKKDDTIT